MRNARKFDERITIGLVPDTEDLEQLKSLGYRTLVDVRDEEEKFGGLVETRAVKLGLRYLSIPISREEIRPEDLERFYLAVYEKGAEPLYVFSRFGKKPLAFILLIDAWVNGDPLFRIFQRARRFGLGGLDGDLALQSFMVRMVNSRALDPVLESLFERRPDLFSGKRRVAPPPHRPAVVSDVGDEQDIQARLAEASDLWNKTKDRTALKSQLEVLLRELAEGS